MNDIYHAQLIDLDSNNDYSHQFNWGLVLNGAVASGH